MSVAGVSDAVKKESRLSFTTVLHVYIKSACIRVATVSGRHPKNELNFATLLQACTQCACMQGGIFSAGKPRVCAQDARNNGKK